MILSMLLAWASQAAGMPPPVTVGRLEPQPISAVSWTCELSGTDHQALKIAGTFPAISVDSQKNGNAYRLQTNMRSTGDERFNGTFAAAMTGSIIGMDNYSIRIPNTSSQIAAFVLSFEFFEPTKSGFVNVAQFDPKSGAPSAYASGLCATQVTQ